MKAILIIKGSWEGALELKEYLTTSIKDHFTVFPSVMVEPQDLKKGAPMRIMLQYEQREKKFIQKVVKNKAEEISRQRFKKISTELQAVS